MAEYETREGEQKIAKSSIYKKSLRVEGFPIAGNYTVTLYSVGRSEERSAPVKITVSPDTPAYLTTYGRLRVMDDFGGITVMADNQYEADLYRSEEHRYELQSLMRIQYAVFRLKNKKES